MDEDGIGLVLARASELRSKITNCIHKASTLGAAEEIQQQQNGDRDHPSRSLAEANREEEEDDDDETESLLNIRDAFESLEAQLTSLQALQQQQCYEREAALAEIDYSRKKLLKNLSEYKGEDLEVIHEAAAFASAAAAVEDRNDLLLPPYPSRPSALVLDGGYFSNFPSKHKSSVQNGVTNNPSIEAKNQAQSGSKRPLNQRLRSFVNAAAKTMITLVGVISVLSLAGFEPRLRKKESRFDVLNVFQTREGEVKRGGDGECPPGKVAVVENGEIRCLVKERVEIPFESVVATPNVNYGCG